VTGANSASNTTTPKPVTAACPGTKVAVGGGYTAVTASGTGLGELTAYGSYPSANNAWTATIAADNTNNLGNWSARAYVICVNP
jgi:hypothetical protein